MENLTEAKKFFGTLMMVTIDTIGGKLQEDEVVAFVDAATAEFYGEEMADLCLNDFMEILNRKVH